MHSHIFLWRGCIVFAGQLPDLPLHAHATEAICAGVDHEITIRGDDCPTWHAVRTAYLPSGCLHEIQMGPCALFGSLLFEPGGKLSGTVRAALEAPEQGFSGIIPNPPIGSAFLNFLQQLCGIQAEHPQESLLDDFLRGVLQTGAPPDERILQVARQITESPVDNIPVEELAASIGMSPSWLLHTFSDAFNMPVRKFRNYSRLQRAALLLKHGESLVSAAVGAGFYDQAHFNNTFKETFGLNPGLIFHEQENIRWHVDSVMEQMCSR